MYVNCLVNNYIMSKDDDNDIETIIDHACDNCFAISRCKKDSECGCVISHSLGISVAKTKLTRRRKFIKVRKYYCSNECKDGKKKAILAGIYRPISSQ